VPRASVPAIAPSQAAAPSSGIRRSSGERSGRGSSAVTRSRRGRACPG
jgi:hypothetical protein